METCHPSFLCRSIVLLLCLTSAPAYVGLQSWLLNESPSGLMIQRGHDRCHQLKHVHEQESRQKRAHSITFLAKQTGRTEAGENDHSLSDAEKEVLEMFKRTVLGERGRLRQMSNERLSQIADAAAESFAEQMHIDTLHKLEKEFEARRRDMGMSTLYDDSDDDDEDGDIDGVAATDGIPVSSKHLLNNSTPGSGGRQGGAEEQDGGDRGVLGQGLGTKMFLESRIRCSPLWTRSCPTEDAEFDSILNSLKAYHRQHGNLLLTHDYVMPKEGDEGAMEEHRGWRLGQKVYNMKFWQQHVRGRPARREELAKLGFVWARLQEDYNLFLEALLAYRELEGSLLVPMSFVVPEREPWPLSCRGMRLGARVAAVRNQSLYVRTSIERWYQLDNMGFVWDLSDAPFRQVSMPFYIFMKNAFQVFDALMTYKLLHGNLRVPVAFRVPSSKPWPRDVWDLALGQRVLDIRVHQRYIKDHPARARALDQAGFGWTDAGEASYTNVVQALKACRKINGRHFLVPSSFVVPPYLPWPRACWGLRLGTTLVDIRSKGRAPRCENGSTFPSISVGHGGNKTSHAKASLCVCLSAERMMELPTSDVRRLLRYLKGEDGDQRRLELQRLGVFAQSRENVLANLVTGVRCYVDVVGDAMVPQGFIVPSGEPWPPECRGNKLGSMLYGLRRHPERLDRYPEIRAELTALGFSWDVPKRGPRGPRRRQVLNTIVEDGDEAGQGVSGNADRRLERSGAMPSTTREPVPVTAVGDEARRRIPGRRPSSVTGTGSSSDQSRYGGGSSREAGEERRGASRTPEEALSSGGRMTTGNREDRGRSIAAPPPAKRALAKDTAA